MSQAEKAVAQGTKNAKTVVLFYSAPLPAGSPGATRVVALAQMIQQAGYYPFMLGIGTPDGGEPAKGSYCGIDYELISVPELALTGWKAPIREKAVKHALLYWLDHYRTRREIVFILYTEMQGYSGFFLRYSRKNGIPVGINLVEWHSKGSFPGVLGLLRYIKNQWDMRFGYVKTKNVIAISSMLQEYYRSKGCNTMRIPTIVDVDSYSPGEKAAQKELILAYAGIPWGKDDIRTVIQAITFLTPEERERIEFRLYGLTEEELRRRGQLDDSAIRLLGKQVRCFGMIPYEQVRTELYKVDFTVLLRDATRKSTAGFPTKVGESMAAGVPVIANLTSDIGAYLHDGVEGLVCMERSPVSCAETFRRAMNLSHEEKNQMRTAARRQAEASFAFRKYVDVIRSFLKDAGVPSA